MSDIEPDAEPLLGGGHPDQLPVGSIQDKTPVPLIVTSTSPEAPHVCPCEQNGDCKHLCCIKTHQEQRKHISPDSASDSGSPRPDNRTSLLSQTNKLGSTSSSYGSFDNNVNFSMKNPVGGLHNTTTEDDSISSEGSDRPLINRDLVRSGQMNGWCHGVKSDSHYA